MLIWLKTNKYASMLLFVLRFYLGYHWISEGIDKLTQGFNAKPFLQNAVEHPVLVAHTKDVMQYPLFTSFLKNFALPHADLFNIVIPLGEFLVGLGLILGCLTTAAIFFAMLMNFMFLYAGTVSVNPWMIMFSFVILISHPNAGLYGLDRWVMPYLRSCLFHKNKHLPNDPRKNTPAA